MQSEPLSAEEIERIRILYVADHDTDTDLFVLRMLATIDTLAERAERAERAEEWTNKLRVAVARLDVSTVGTSQYWSARNKLTKLANVIIEVGSYEQEEANG